MCDRCAAVLADILAELRELRAEARPRRCSDADAEALRRFLPAVVGAFGSQPTTVDEMLRRPDLRAVANGNQQVIGNLLGRAVADNATVRGLRVEKCGREGNKTLWSVTGRLL